MEGWMGRWMDEFGTKCLNRELGLTLLVCLIDFRWLQKLQQRQANYDWWWMMDDDLWSWLMWSPSSHTITCTQESSMPCVPKNTKPRWQPKKGSHWFSFIVVWLKISSFIPSPSPSPLV
jgi:hypothetical protein